MNKMLDYTPFCETLRGTLTQITDSVWAIGPDGQTLSSVHETWRDDDPRSGASLVVSGAIAYRQHQQGASVQQIALTIVNIYREQQAMQAADFALLRDRLKITLTIPRSAESSVLIQQPAVGSLVTALVLDFDQHVRYVTQQDVQQWQQPESALWNIAEHHMTPLPCSVERWPLDDGGTFTLFTEDFAAISAWRQAAAQSTSSLALCAIPAKETAAVMTHFTRWPDALRGLDQFIHQVLADAPLHPLIPQIVLFDQGTPRLVTSV